jgi:hypothetical protein
MEVAFQWFLPQSSTWKCLIQQNFFYSTSFPTTVTELFLSPHLLLAMALIGTHVYLSDCTCALSVP